MYEVEYASPCGRKLIPLVVKSGWCSPSSSCAEVKHAPHSDVTSLNRILSMCTLVEQLSICMKGLLSCLADHPEEYRYSDPSSLVPDSGAPRRSKGNAGRWKIDDETARTALKK